MKRKLLALMLVLIMCCSSSVAMAYTDTFNDVNINGVKATATASGVLYSSTMFEGSTSVSVNATVDVYAEVYTILATGEEVFVRRGGASGNGYCHIDQTNDDFPAVGTYAISTIIFAHGVYQPNSTYRIVDHYRLLQY